MKTFLLTLTLVSALAAQTQTRQPSIAPWGLWTVCEVVPSAMGCETFHAGSEQYMLFIPGDGQETAYRYTVFGQLADGTTVTKTGLVDRAPKYDTAVLLDFGGRMTSWTICVDDLIVMASR